MSHFLEPRRFWRAELASPFPVRSSSPLPALKASAWILSLFLTALPGLDMLGRFGDAGQMQYTGGKNGPGVFQRIINLMPPHRVYIEPFLGSGAILRLKRPAVFNIGVEVDPEVLAEFLASLKSAGSAELAKTGDTARSPADPAVFRAFSPDVDHRDLERWTPALGVISGDGLEYLKRRKFEGDELVYCDPPYLRATRSSGRLYRHEFDESQHLQLLRCIRRIPARVMISGYWSQMYASALKGWTAVNFNVTTRGRRATEWLWFNYPKPTQLHDYSFLGDSFRERERINRKKKRWAARLRRMDTLERQALLSVIEAEWFSGSQIAQSGDGDVSIAPSGDGAREGGAGVRPA
jgi:DNA adenine methylase